MESSKNGISISSYLPSFNTTNKSAIKVENVMSTVETLAMSTFLDLPIPSSFSDENRTSSNMYCPTSVSYSESEFKHHNKNNGSPSLTISNPLKHPMVYSVTQMAKYNREPFSDITFQQSLSRTLPSLANLNSTAAPLCTSFEETSPPESSTGNKSPAETPKGAKIAKHNECRFPKLEPSSISSQDFDINKNASQQKNDSIVNFTSSPACMPQSAEGTKKVSVYPKPPYSYSYLIILAFKNSRNGYLPVSDVYTFVRRHFPFYETATEVWKNSIRHNLSLSKGFEKVGRYGPEAPSSKNGCLWAMNPDKIPKFDEELAKVRSKDLEIILDSMRYPDKLDLIESGCHGFGGIANALKSQYGASNFSGYVRLYMKESLLKEPFIQLDNKQWDSVTLPEHPVSVNGIYVSNLSISVNIGKAPALNAVVPVQSGANLLNFRNELPPILPYTTIQQRNLPFNAGKEFITTTCKSEPMTGCGVSGGNQCSSNNMCFAVRGMEEEEKPRLGVNILQQTHNNKSVKNSCAQRTSSSNKCKKSASDKKQQQQQQNNSFNLNENSARTSTILTTNPPPAYRHNNSPCSFARLSDRNEEMPPFLSSSEFSPQVYCNNNALFNSQSPHHNTNSPHSILPMFQVPQLQPHRTAYNSTTPPNQYQHHHSQPLNSNGSSSSGNVISHYGCLPAFHLQPITSQTVSNAASPPQLYSNECGALVYSDSNPTMPTAVATPSGMYTPYGSPIFDHFNSYSHGSSIVSNRNTPSGHGVTVQQPNSALSSSNQLSPYSLNGMMGGGVGVILNYSNNNNNASSSNSNSCSLDNNNIEYLPYSNFGSNDNLFECLPPNTFYN